MKGNLFKWGVISATSLGFSLLSADIVKAQNLLTNGDFQSGVQPPFQPFDPDGSFYDQWLGNPGTPPDSTGNRWPVVNDGAGKDGAGDFYARHFENTLNLYQGIDASSFDIGHKFQLHFDYVSENAFDSTDGRSVTVYGLNKNANSGSGDRISNFPPCCNTPGTLLYSSNTLPSANTWTPFSDEFTLNAEYDALVVLFTMGAFNGDGLPAPEGLRGIDNVSLKKVPVPEPVTLLGIVASALGIVTSKRKLSS